VDTEIEAMLTELLVVTIPSGQSYIETWKTAAGSYFPINDPAKARSKEKTNHHSSIP
jgi:hypothetical protein